MKLPLFLPKDHRAEKRTLPQKRRSLWLYKCYVTIQKQNKIFYWVCGITQHLLVYPEPRCGETHSAAIMFPCSFYEWIFLINSCTASGCLYIQSHGMPAVMIGGPENTPGMITIHISCDIHKKIAQRFFFSLFSGLGWEACFKTPRPLSTR